MEGTKTCRVPQKGPVSGCAPRNETPTAHNPSYFRLLRASCNPCLRHARSQAAPCLPPYAIHLPSLTRPGTRAQPQPREKRSIRLHFVQFRERARHVSYRESNAAAARAPSPPAQHQPLGSLRAPRQGPGGGVRAPWGLPYFSTAQ
jgi:hypothetical protein